VDTKLAPQALDLLDDEPRMIKEALAGRGQRDTTAIARQEVYTKLLLHSTNAGDAAEACNDSGGCTGISSRGRRRRGMPANPDEIGTGMTATLGEDAQRIDGRDKVSGKPIYGADRILPKIVHAVPVVATVRKGRITGIDTSGAQRASGVLLILTHENFDRLKPVKFSFAGGGTAIQSFQPLQSAEVKYRGQAVALVVAETLEAAQEAAALIRISYS
jgi:hypothetical protein